MTTKLKDLSVGECAKVAGFSGCSAEYRRKLLCMGLTPGAEFQVQRFAPLGDPVEIRVRGCALCLRKYEAEALEVQRVAE